MSKLALLGLLCAFAPVFPQSYPLVGPQDSLYNTFDLPEAQPGDTPYWESFKWGVDAPTSVLRVDGNWHYYSSQFNRVWEFQPAGDSTDILGMKAATSVRNADFYGQNASQLQTGGVDTTIVKNNAVYLFMPNIYKASNGDLYGFMHIEDEGDNCGGGPPCPVYRSYPFHDPSTAPSYGAHSQYRIGLAWCPASSGSYPCEGGGWQFLGKIIAPSLDSMHFNGSGGLDYATNIGGVPYLVKDGYIYVYFNEWVNPAAVSPGANLQWLSVARASITDIQDQAENYGIAGGASSPWKKFNGGGYCNSHVTDNGCWTTNAMTGLGGLLPNLQYRDAHTDIVYSSVTHDYYLPISDGSDLNLYSSTDGINWGSPVTIASGLGWPRYPAFLPVLQDRSSDDGHIVGNYVYITYSNPDPVAADSDSYGRRPSAIYRRKITFAAPNRAARVDFDGDGKSDLAAKTDYSYGDWWMDYSSNGFGTATDYTFQNADDYHTLYGGDVHDIPVPADYDGDGLTDIATKRYYGDWGIDYAANGFNGFDVIYSGWGDSTCIPVPADYDGDGKIDLAVYNTNGYSGGWSIDYAANGFNGEDDFFSNFATPHYHPVPADYDGDGRAEMAYKSDDDGSWNINFGNDGYSFSWYPGWGDSTSHAVPADYDGDGKADLAVKTDYGYGDWYIDYASNGFGSANDYPYENADEYHTTYGGGVNDIAVPGDYDGDGKADIAEKHGDGTWVIDYSSNGFDHIDDYFYGWGDSTSHPMAKKFVADASLRNSLGQVSFDFTLPQQSNVRIAVYAADGSQVALLFQGKLLAGSHQMAWSKKEVAPKALKSGVYFLSLRSDKFNTTKKIVFAE